MREENQPGDMFYPTVISRVPIATSRGHPLKDQSDTCSLPSHGSAYQVTVTSFSRVTIALSAVTILTDLYFAI